MSEPNVQGYLVEWIGSDGNTWVACDASATGALAMKDRHSGQLHELVKLADVAELIEASEAEYAAEAAYSTAKTGKPRNDAWAAVEAARVRRRAALASIGSAS